MTGPFEMIGGQAPACDDGACAFPAQHTEDDQSMPHSDRN